MFPISRDTTYLAGISEVKSADLNELQDNLFRLFRDTLNFPPLRIDHFTASTLDQARIRGIAHRPQVPLDGRSILVAAHAAGDDIIYGSDGIHWALITSIGAFNGIEHSRAIVWSPLLGKWVIMTANGSTDDILTAPDHLGAWTARTDPAGMGARGGMAENDDVLICPGDTAVIADDGSDTWGTANVNAAAGTQRAAAWSPSLGLFVTVGDGGSAQSSVDEASWIDRTAGVPAALTAVNFTDVVWDAVNEWFWAGGPGGKAMRSDDGLTWEDVSLDGGMTDDLISAAVDGRGTIMACADDYVLFSFDGGANWLVQNRPSHLTAATVAGMFANGRPLLFGTQAITGYQGVALGTLGQPVTVLTP